MTKTISAICAILGLMAVAATSAQACEKFVEIPNPRIEELMAVINESGTSELKQLLGFEELACSEKPTVRKFAIDAGMASKSKTLRAQALAVLMMQRDQIKIEILEELKGDQTMESFFRQNGRNLSYKFTSRNPASNCVSFSASYKCPEQYMIVMDGLTVRIQDRDKFLSGTFTLQPDNSLRGTILIDRAARAVAAKIDLDK